MITTKPARWLALVAALCLAALCVVAGLHMTAKPSSQLSYYNQALAAYNAALQSTTPKEAVDNLDKAVKLFDQSIAAYESERRGSLKDKLTSPSPSAEYAALAHFHKGVALLLAAQVTKKKELVQQAMESFQDSLKINPGGPYKGVSPETAQRLTDEAMVVKYDLELLLKKHPGMNRQPGKGDGKGGPPQQAPGSKGNIPGHGDSDSI